MEDEEKTVLEVLYETRRHSSRPYTSNYPPRQGSQKSEGKDGLFSLLSVRGVSQLKEKWSSYWHPRKLKRRVSLVISPRGEHVAVAAGNQITILQKEDDYREPCGIFIASDLGTFIHGAWSESHDVLGIADDTDTLCFIKANGEEITRITRRQLKASSAIVGLIAHYFDDLKRSCLCSFIILTSDGILHQIEISHQMDASISSMQSSMRSSTIKHQFPLNILCFDFYPQLSLLVFVGSAANMSVASSRNSGSSYLSMWRISQRLEIKPLSLIEFEGLCSATKDQVACPKVLISPLGKFVATLDMGGCLHLFRLDKESWSLSSFAFGERLDSQAFNKSSNGLSEISSDIVDFTWWSDRIVVLAKRSGIVTMFDILCGVKLQEDDPVYSMPVLERVYQFQGHLFILESILPQEGCNKFNCDKKITDLQCSEEIAEDRFDQFDISRLCWCLISFSQRSVLEMYNILISDRQYQAALDFADHHSLDRDEVLKSQWLHSGQGVDEINIFLSNIQDQAFVLSECINRVGPTEDALKTLLAYGLRLTNQYGFSESGDHESPQLWDFRLARLQLLQFGDRLETYLGINMGRFSVQGYSKFRDMPISEAALELAESGKIGALNLFFKRHPYSLTPSMLQILAAIPETVPVQTYGQLLPGRSSPTSTAIRKEDWVECDKMVTFINKLPENLEIGLRVKTEPIVKQSTETSWPSIIELSAWYKSRSRDIDSYSGQLDNCLCLVDFGCLKGISELQRFHADVSYLHQLIYSDESDGELCLNMTLATWEQLSDYEKFRVTLRGVTEENVVGRLHDKAIPFMQNRLHDLTSVTQDQVTDVQFSVDPKDESFLVRWLKEIAVENKLDICLTVFEEGCKEFPSNGFFRDEVQAIDCAIQCIYLCTATDRWSTMASILSKLPQKQDTEIHDEDLLKRIKQAEAHVEAGRILAFYQVPKPMSFFLEAHADGKGVKQILRLMLSKFSRRQPGRLDNDWASMWRDMHCLQEKAFPLLDLEYMLMEFCRGLLKAGKFSLARNYLKGTSSVALAPEKAENLVIQAAREYFFSASSLASAEIWKAKECLNILPSSRNVKAEADIIDALTVKLPNLGVTLLPMQFRQIKDPMEIIKMAITCQAGAYLLTDELIEVAKLLGMNSSGDISTVQEAIAREAAVAGDLQLAFDLCLILAKKGHGLIWDLCAAIARGPALENMNISSRKQLLGFALSHCDEESIGELLHAWKDLDMQGQCEALMVLNGTNSPNFSVHGSSVISHPVYSIQDMVDLKDCSELVEEVNSDDQEVYFNKIKNILSGVVKESTVDGGTNWESLLRQNEKILSFVALQLPGLLELSTKAEYGKKKLISGVFRGSHNVSIRTQSMVTILSWLARNGFSPTDSLIASLAKSVIEPPVTEDEDVIGCSFLLNLVDAFNGVEVIEEQLKMRDNYKEICSIMNVGMTYSSLHNSGLECEDPAQRRELLLRKFREKHASLNTDDINKIDETQSSFWREWKLKLEEKKRIADHSRMLERIIPGVEATRFLSGDSSYIRNVVFSLLESIKLEKKLILKDVLNLVDTYGLNRIEIVLQYLSSVFVSGAWTDDDIMDEISKVRGEIIGHAAETIKTVSLVVYPAIDGCNKQRLACIYGLLSECYLQLERAEEQLPMIHQGPVHIPTLELAHYYKIIEQECRKVLFIKNLNFKNIAGLDGLNLQNFESEVYTHLDKFSLEPLAEMVQNLVSIYPDPVTEGLILWQDVYKHYIFSLLTTLVTRAEKESRVGDPENFVDVITQAEETYDLCKSYIKLLAPLDALEIMKQYFKVIIPLHGVYGNIPDNSTWQDCLIILLNFWIRLTEGMQEFTSTDKAENLCFRPQSLMSCLKVLMRLVMEDIIAPSQGWGSIIGYVNQGLIGDFATETLIFCRAMVFTGCKFVAISEVFSESASSCTTTDTEIQDLPCLYLCMLEPILQELVHGSNENQNLYNLLSSLSKLEGEIAVLKRVRHVVWDKLATVSDDPQLPSHIRVYILELMQFISGRTVKGFSAEITQNVVPWDEWDELLCTSQKHKTTSNQGLPDHIDSSSRFTSTLVALKSSQLVAAISPSMEITPNDLLNVETAIACFLKLCSASSANIHYDVLVAILEEWEGLFVIGKEEINSAESSDAGNNWSNDDWDEGWETFQEAEPLEKEEENCFSVHPLHTCWAEIFRKLIAVSQFRDVLKLIDHSFLRSNGVLLNEDEARTLSQILLGKDCFLALKMVLLLPYESVQFQCLDEVENKLKQGGVSDMIGSDHELLMLVLSSGITSSVVTKSYFSNTFYYVSYLVGNLSRKYQELHLSRLAQGGRNQLEDNELFVFARLVFPCFIAELVKANQHILAGFLVSKTMHTNESLSLLNVVEASLCGYLKRQLHVLQEGDIGLEVKSLCEILKGTVSKLRGKLPNLIQSALSLFSDTVV
ncbi:hypothetical protein HS088_TW19G00909 [Tripterygium wilfordii]|uniref:Sec39 domain-containing protein n=1 Tax=Tripterygium wilfordii TaxID=458696 RepID=A0A7J7CB21_TRIWF|nr:MAG2-interacting protein 2 [Tripterygium wilfordii]KAF5731302.1 hypothetical protein HS088_TW19G00909 [Tripterygium wilfordii]